MKNANKQKTGFLHSSSILFGIVCLFFLSNPKIVAAVTLGSKETTITSSFSSSSPPFPSLTAGECSTMRSAAYNPDTGDVWISNGTQVPQPRGSEVSATAVNRADLVQVKGNYPPPPGESDILGLEAVGIVHKLGSNVSRWKIGDRVMALVAGGGNAEFVSVHEDNLMKIPDDMDMVDAAAVPEVWLTSYQLLHFVARIQQGDSILIHAGASGVGTAAVQLAKLAGASKVYVTTSSEEKIRLAKDLGADEGFNYREVEFDTKVLEVTQGRGVDIILDCVGGSYWTKNLNALALDGRWVLFGTLGGSNVDGPLIKGLMRKRARMEGTTLRSRSIEYKAKLMREFEQKVLPLFSEKNKNPLKIVIYRVLAFDEFAHAHEIINSNSNSGKVVLMLE